ncbi:tRNA (guanine-N(7)-)-methyltransferase [Spiroplasma alleghenense]|uniref:tRNA (guanine-N(7)-)-methyltransferase n=2 Tax=Spiroplasma alleghenense TaxID=216931 RepID=A0A345Z2C9_9MOLU|nr:tRNA (guanine-N(7)-)-methyltransferase [Spiroplasma alleghenense]
MDFTVQSLGFKMRLRNKPWTESFLKENQWWLLPVIVKEPLNLEKIYANKNPIHLEIGCGKGGFITNLASQNKNINFVAMEKETTVIGVAVKKSLTTNPDLKNLRFLNSYAEKLEEYFSTNSVERIYLNFSDPWPKSRHAKKRLTFTTFLNIYKNILVDGGEIHIKTDNDKLYEFTLEMVELNQWKLVSNTNDLYNDKNLLKNNIPTEYETKFHNLGKNINKIIIKK